MKNIFKKNSALERKIFPAFTLIEIMIVLSIVGILSGGGFVAYQSSKQEAAFRATKREVAKVIRLTQSYALQGKLQNMGNTIGERTPCGYGFEFTDAYHYRIFYTYKEDPTDSESNCKNNRIYPGNDGDRLTAKNGEVEQKFELPDNISITEEDFSSTRFYFTIPFGNVFESTDTNEFFGRSLEFQYGSPSYTDLIIINKKGDVDEQ